MNTLKKLLPTILPLLIALAYALDAPIANYLGSHPTLLLVAGAVGAIINHWLPSPAGNK